jgi:uncharacterized protein
MNPASRILRHDEHRPWPLAAGPWVMFQSWRNLLFAHWPVPADALGAFVPAGLVVEEFDGTAWLGLTPFRVTGLRPRLLPPVPLVSSFPEMNLRTYVRHGQRSGVLFITLDAGSLAAVVAARAAYGLPYRRARMRVRRRDGWIEYRSERRDGSAAFAARYRPRGSPFQARAGTLEHFLTERYALYSVRGGTLVRGDIHHLPWPLQHAEADIRANTVPQAHGIAVPAQEPLLHYSERQDTLVWAPTPV